MLSRRRLFRTAVGVLSTALVLATVPAGFAAAGPLPKPRMIKMWATWYTLNEDGSQGKIDSKSQIEIPENTLPFRPYFDEQKMSEHGMMLTITEVVAAL